MNETTAYKDKQAQALIPETDAATTPPRRISVEADDSNEPERERRDEPAEPERGEPGEHVEPVERETADPAESARADPTASERDCSPLKTRLREDPNLDEDVHEAHEMPMPFAPLGH